MFTRIWTYFYRSEFLKNVSVQMIGVGIAQMLPFLATPVLARLFSEEDFALYTSFFAIANICAIGAGARYQYAIMIPKENSEAIKVFMLSIYISCVYALLLLVGFIVFKDIDFKIGNTIYLIPLYVLFFGIWNSFSNLSIRLKTFKNNSISKVLHSVVYILLGIGTGFLKIMLNGLIISKIFGVFASWIYLLKKSEIKIKLFQISELKEVAKKYIEYPKYGLIPAFLDTASLQGLVLILTWFYSKEIVGYLGLTQLVLSAPLGLIGISFREVFYQKITSLINTGQFTNAVQFFKKSALGLFVIGAPISLIIAIFGEDLFLVIFGSKWGKSGIFASILSFSFLIKLVVSPLSSVFNASSKLKISSYWQITYFITTFSVLGICSYVLNLDIYPLLIVYVIHEIALYMLYFALQYRTLKRLK